MLQLCFRSESFLFEHVLQDFEGVQFVLAQFIPSTKNTTADDRFAVA